jgi:peptidoglycan/LPS O-acetylase OafA/YrhL
MIEPLSGAVTIGFVVAAALFFNLGRGSGERLYFAFALALGLLAANQLVALWLGEDHEYIAYVYGLRLIGFVVVLAALVEKNLRAWKQPVRP